MRVCDITAYLLKKSSLHSLLQGPDHLALYLDPPFLLVHQDIYL
jgi:hypothetical protein